MLDLALIEASFIFAAIFELLLLIEPFQRVKDQCSSSMHL